MTPKLRTALLPIAASLVLAGCAAAPTATSAPTPTPSATGYDLAATCALASDIGTETWNADAAFDAGDFDAAEWHRWVSTATSQARLLLKDTAPENRPLIQPMSDALAALPDTPTGRNTAGDAAHAGDISKTCNDNGTPINIWAQYGG